MTKIKQFIYHDKMWVTHVFLTLHVSSLRKRKILGLLNVTKSLYSCRSSSDRNWEPSRVSRVFRRKFNRS